MKASKGAKQNLYDGFFFIQIYNADWLDFFKSQALFRGKKTACIISHFITSALILRSTSEAMGNLGEGLVGGNPLKAFWGHIAVSQFHAQKQFFLSYYECISALTYNKSVNPKSFRKIICYLPNPQVLHILKD